MNQIQKATKALGNTINKNSPSILIGLGISGFIGSIAMAIEATPKALEQLDGEAYGRFKGHGTWRDIPVKERIELVWPVYVPMAATATLSAAAIFMGNRIHLRRAAALASLYSLAEGTLKSYQEKVLKTVGENKAKQIQGDVAQEAMEKTVVDMVHNEGGGHELSFDMFTGRYFMSTADKIRSAVNTFNEELLREDVKSLNELYYELGLPYVELGDKVGWRLDYGLLELSLGSRMAADDRPCLTIDFVNRPQYLHK